MYDTAPASDSVIRVSTSNLVGEFLARVGCIISTHGIEKVSTQYLQLIILRPVPDAMSYATITPVLPVLWSLQVSCLVCIIRQQNENVSMPSCSFRGIRWKVRLQNCRSEGSVWITRFHKLWASYVRDNPVAHLTPVWVLTTSSIRIRQDQGKDLVFRVRRQR